MKKLFLLVILAIRAHATIALVAHAIAQAGTLGATSITTSAINCSGANFLVMAAAYDNSVTSPTPSDSSSNTWITTLTSQNGGGLTAKFFYVEGATVSASQTFTLTVTGSTNGIVEAVACYSGVLASASHDQENSGSSTGGANGTTGSVTPSQANELVVSMAGVASNTTGLPTFSSSSGNTFTRTDGDVFVSGTAYGDSLIYFIQTTATAENVTWTPNGAAGGQSMIIETFKASAGGGTVPPASKEKKLLKEDAGLVPVPICINMVVPDCYGFTNGTVAAFSCLNADTSCGTVTLPLAPDLTATGAVTMGQHTCVLGANLGLAAKMIGSLGSVDAGFFGYSCTP